MDQLHLDLLDRARGLSSAKALIDRAIQELIAEAVSAEIDITALSQALAMHRSTVYRNMPAVAAD
jgi:transcriptional regulator of acetoin/glycerol metabolism